MANECSVWRVTDDGREILWDGPLSKADAEDLAIERAEQYTGRFEVREGHDPEYDNEHLQPNDLKTREQLAAELEQHEQQPKSTGRNRTNAPRVAE